MILTQTTIHHSDKDLYGKIRRENKALRSTGSLERHPSFQAKQNTQKDVWTSKNNERIHFQICSDRSKLSLLQKKDKIQAIEDLQEVVCNLNFDKISGKLKATNGSIQSLETSDKKQNITFSDGVYLTTKKEGDNLSIQADNALYEIGQNQTIEFSNHVEIQWNKQTSATGGSAVYLPNLIVLSQESEKNECHLYHLASHIQSKEIQFATPEEKITCLSPHGTIYLEEEVPLFFSSNSLVWQSQILSLEQNVSLFSPAIQHNETFALADKITIDQNQQHLILSAEFPKRVLFWQQGISLSAPEIHIYKDPITNEEQIQGKGDIHFNFTIEEQNIIDQFISQYL